MNANKDRINNIPLCISHLHVGEILATKGSFSIWAFSHFDDIYKFLPEGEFSHVLSRRKKSKAVDGPIVGAGINFFTNFVDYICRDAAALEDARVQIRRNCLSHANQLECVCAGRLPSIMGTEQKRN